MPLLTINDLLNHAPNDLTHVLKQAQELSNIYDSWAESDEGDGPDRKPGIHASEVAGCPRKMVYAIRGTPRVGANKKFWRQRFKAGQAIHSWLQDDFHRMAQASGGAILFEDEVRLSPQHQELAKFWGIQSSCDGVFTFQEACGEGEEGETLWKPVLRVGLEIKTEAPDGFKELKEPKPDHIEQAHVYMACLDLPLMWFFYMNKGNQNNTPSQGPWLIPFDDARWHEMEKRFQEAHDHVHVGTLPPRSEGIQCEFCAFRAECKPDYLKPKVKFPPLRVPSRP